MLRLTRSILWPSLALAVFALSAQAGNFSSDFNGGVPVGTTLYGNAAVEATGGVDNSGVLKITKAINDQFGSFVIDDLDAGNLIYGFDLSCKLRIAGGNGLADGFSINFGPDVPDGTSSGAEEGVGSGLRFCFDIYINNTENVPARSIDVKIGGTTLLTTNQTIASITTGAAFEDLRILVASDGQLSMAYKGNVLFTNFFIPGYQPLAGRFWFGGRTGGENANQWIDNLQITTFTQPRVGIRQQPLAQKVLSGHDAIFRVEITNPDGCTFQWFDGPNALPSATADTLTLPAVTAADSGKRFKVRVTGPNNIVDSDEVTLTVVNLPVPAPPQLAFNFDTGIPDGTFITGLAYVDSTSGLGVNGTGNLRLVDALAGQAGGFIIADPNGGAPVYGFSASFKTLVGGGSTPPADGFAFAFGSDIPDNPTGDFDAGVGLGSGVIVSFDIYNNDGTVGTPPYEVPPAPSIDVRFKNQVVASAHLPLWFMETGMAYDDTIIRLENDGTIDVVYRGVMVLENVSIPGFTSISGGRFALAARTGGLYENIWIDNLDITTDLTSGAVRIATQPASQVVLTGKPATFSVAVSDPTGVTYQWFKGTTAIDGANSDSYTLPAAAVADSGASFTVQCTRGSTVTSDEAILTVVDLTAPPAPEISYDFDNGLLPAGTAVYGHANVAGAGGLNGSGVLQVTIAQNDQNGAFVMPPVQSGAEVSALWVAFDVQIGGGTSPPADGISFNWAANLTQGTIGGSEDGSGTGLTIGFDTWDNGASENPPAPSIDVRYKGALVATTKYPLGQLTTGNDFYTVLIRVTEDGKLDFAFGDRVIQHGLQLPNYSFITGGRIAFYAHTGGANANHFVDNLRIQATKSVAPLRIATEPQDALVLAGKSATFSVALSDPVGATYQWYKNNQLINGATTATYTTPATVLGDNGAGFSVRATGPGGTANSRSALLTVVAPITISNPNVLFDFNDVAVPVGTRLNSAMDPTLQIPGGYLDYAGGVTNSGVLKLTDNVNGQGGTFIIEDFNSGAAVSSFTAYFAAMIGGGTTPPADGFAFVWANNLNPAVVFGEGGSGSGLIVSFDIFDNGGGEAPAFEVLYQGNSLVNKKAPLSAIETGLGVFGDVFIRVNPTGTLDVQYNGQAIFHQLVLPGFEGLAGSQFAVGGRTGGLNEYQWIDNIAIATSTAPLQPNLEFDTTAGLSLTWGPSFKLQSTPRLANPDWTDVLNATSPYTPPLTGPGLFYRLVNTP